MRRFTSVLTTVMLPLALASCEGRKDAPPEAFGPHEVASPATKVTPPQADDTSAPHVAEHPATLPRITMHKDPNCECCSLWARHVEGAGFPVSVVADTHMDAFKRSVGVPAGNASGRQLRTAPLWGLASSAPYMHDGRASTVEAAVRRHAGEAARSAEAFAALPVAEREALLRFLDAL